MVGRGLSGIKEFAGFGSTVMEREGRMTGWMDITTDETGMFSVFR